MRMNGFGRRWRLLSLAVGAMLVVSAGITFAAIPDSGGVIHGCFKKSGGGDDDDGGGKGSLRVIDTAKNEKCKKSETALDWSQTGPQGLPGEDGEDGEDGTDAVEEYGIASVLVTRGGTTLPWGVYSTELGSPVADTTGGTFRFTCNTTGGCTVRVIAAVLSPNGPVASAKFYPRLLLYRGGDPNGPLSPEFYCEYGDSKTPPNGQLVVGELPTGNAFDGAAMDLDIGISADCGQSQAPGTVTEINVPTGFYDVFATFAFDQQ